MIALVMESAQQLTMFLSTRVWTTTAPWTDLEMEKASDTPIGIKNPFKCVNVMEDSSVQIAHSVRIFGRFITLNFFA